MNYTARRAGQWSLYLSSVHAPRSPRTYYRGRSNSDRDGSCCKSQTNRRTVRPLRLHHEFFVIEIEALSIDRARGPVAHEVQLIHGVVAVTPRHIRLPQTRRGI